MYKYIEAETIGYGIEKALFALSESGVSQVRENQDREEEMIEIQLCLDVLNPLEEPAISKAIPCGLEQLRDYDREFLDGTADNAGWKYTYHGLYAPFYDKLINELNRNPHTRRACIALGQGDINFTSDPPCLQLLMVNIVRDKLELTCVFRSNDGLKAFPMNIHAISMLQKQIADDLGYEVGPLHYIANNFHCYHKDINTLNQYCNIFRNAKPERRFYSLKDLAKFD